MTTTLTHTRPALTPVVIQINVDITAPFWLAWAVCWLGWLAVGRVGRFIRKFLYEYPRAVVVVSGRRLRRWLRGNLRLFEWTVSGLWVWPCMGVG